MHQKTTFADKHFFFYESEFLFKQKNQYNKAKEPAHNLQMRTPPD